MSLLITQLGRTDYLLCYEIARAGKSVQPGNQVAGKSMPLGGNLGLRKIRDGKFGKKEKKKRERRKKGRTEIKREEGKGEIRGKKGKIREKG